MANSLEVGVWHSLASGLALLCNLRARYGPHIYPVSVVQRQDRSRLGDVRTIIGVQNNHPLIFDI